MPDRGGFREPWFQQHEAIALVRQYLQCSIGKAQAMIDRAVASGEVRTEQAAIEDFTCKTGSRVKAITRYSGDDLLYWLKPQIPQQQPPAETGARTKSAQDEAGRAIAALFPDRVPSHGELSNKELRRRVCRWLEADYANRKDKPHLPSERTVRRAAGRK